MVVQWMVELGDVAVDFDAWFEEVPPDEIVLSTNEVPLSLSMDDDVFDPMCNEV